MAKIRYKTIRFEQEVWDMIEFAAERKGITTSAYIRRKVEKGLPEVHL